MMLLHVIAGAITATLLLSFGAPDWIALLVFVVAVMFDF